MNAQHSNLIRKMPLQFLRHSPTVPLVKMLQNSGSHFHCKSKLEINYVKP